MQVVPQTRGQRTEGGAVGGLAGHQRKPRNDPHPQDPVQDDAVVGQPEREPEQCPPPGPDPPQCPQQRDRCEERQGPQIQWRIGQGHEDAAGAGPRQAGDEWSALPGQAQSRQNMRTLSFS